MDAADAAKEPGGCTWCIELCFGLDLVIWEGSGRFTPVACDTEYVDDD